MTSRTARKRVLSIQSHVVYGYVGNKAATFPLQLLGYDVDPVNSVQYCNHSGYPTVAGEKLSSDQLTNLISGLQANEMLPHYTHLLTGYIPTAPTLETLTTLLPLLRTKNPSLHYTLDPVLGDNQALYVPSTLIPIYRSLIPHATVITPNAFEASILAETSITTLQSALDTADKLHQMGAQTIIVTSMELVDYGDNSCQYLLTSHPQTDTRFLIPFTPLPYRFTGTGDLFSALITAYIDLSSTFKIKAAIQKAIGVLQAVLRDTVQKATADGEIDMKLVDGKINEEYWKRMELDIIGCRKWVLGEEEVDQFTAIDI